MPSGETFVGVSHGPLTPSRYMRKTGLPAIVTSTVVGAAVPSCCEGGLVGSSGGGEVAESTQAPSSAIVVRYSVVRIDDTDRQQARCLRPTSLRRPGCNE